MKVKEPLRRSTGSCATTRRSSRTCTWRRCRNSRASLIDSKVTAIAYETVQLPDGSLPLLIPMSQIAGRMATEIGAQYLRKPGPGRGKLISGLPGAPPAHVVVLGAGIVAENAIETAVGSSARA